MPAKRLSRPASIGYRRVRHYRSPDWDRMRSYIVYYSWRRICFSLDDPNIAEVVLQSIKLFIPFSAVPIGSKSLAWFGYLSKTESRSVTEGRAAAPASRDEKNSRGKVFVKVKKFV